MKELLTVYNEKLEEIGVASRYEVHQKGLKHKVVHCWIIEKDSDNASIYFQQRSFNKADFPGMYDIACAGHIDAGEKIENAMIREIEEEIGLSIGQSELKYIGRKFETFEVEGFSDDEICEMYVLEVNKDTSFKLGEEVEDMVKVPFKEYEKWINGDLQTLGGISVINNKNVKIHNKDTCPHIKEYNRQLFEFI